MLTVRELAEYLNLNEKIVYKLVREKRIPGTRVSGKWTFSKNLIRNWIEFNSLDTPFGANNPPLSVPSSDLYISGSDDILVERIISSILKTESPDILAFFSPTGSMGGLKALQMGKAHIAGIHLYDHKSDVYNTPYLKEHLSRETILLYNLAYRNQGFITRGDINLNSIHDIINNRLRFINREPGSGTRILMDYLCEKNGLSPRNIIGYENELFTHFEVGLTILKGDADVGLGIECVSHYLGLKFIPLRKERYDLVVPSKNLSLRPVQIFFNIIHSKQFHSMVKGMIGYDLKDSGKLISMN
ncbi:MAG: helix-turn-helix transcriptional regulator [Chitinispirillia bacterium]